MSDSASGLAVDKDKYVDEIAAGILEKLPAPYDVFALRMEVPS